MLRFRVLGASFSSFRVLRFRVLECFVFEFWVLRFRVLGASVSSFRVLPFRVFGCFVFDLGVVVFEIWVLHASVFVFECSVFESTLNESGTVVSAQPTAYV